MALRVGRLGCGSMCLDTCVLAELFHSKPIRCPSEPIGTTANDDFGSHGENLTPPSGELLSASAYGQAKSAGELFRKLRSSYKKAVPGGKISR